MRLRRARAAAVVPPPPPVWPESTHPWPGERVLVTGGAGFLGSVICRDLLRLGARVTTFQRSAAPELEADGATVIRGDLTDPIAVRNAIAGSTVVFHVAAKAGIWGHPADFEAINVQGTRHVLAACREHGIDRLVYTSSPSVVYHGRDEEGLDESAPYPAEYLADYPRTKAVAEREVLAANGPTLKTVALRPHLVWGPGDNHLFPRLVERARSGRLVRIGRKSRLVDTVYVDNAALAHRLAAERLSLPDATCAGRPYFVTNGEPRPLWDQINDMLDCAGLPPVKLWVPASLAYAAGAAFESVYAAMGRTAEPPMTRFVARQLSTAHWYNLEAARRDLGYAPFVSINAGLWQLREWWGA